MDILALSSPMQFIQQCRASHGSRRISQVQRTPTIPAGATAAQTGEVVRQHAETLREWKEYTNMQAALKKQLISAVDPIYLR